MLSVCAMLQRLAFGHLLGMLKRHYLGEEKVLFHEHASWGDYIHYSNLHPALDSYSDSKPMLIRVSGLLRFSQFLAQILLLR